MLTSDGAKKRIQFCIKRFNVFESYLIKLVRASRWASTYSGIVCPMIETASS
jgi:hypothetical protein